ncbi:MAG: hypothetical protein ACOZF0_17155 [Thermodesulfobacteriota bacterium]
MDLLNRVWLRAGSSDELNLLLKIGGRRLAFEIKLTSSPSKQDLDKPCCTAQLVGTYKTCLSPCPGRVPFSQALPLEKPYHAESKTLGKKAWHEVTFSPNIRIAQHLTAMLCR